jgi:hypothetical protein
MLQGMNMGPMIRDMVMEMVPKWAFPVFLGLILLGLASWVFLMVTAILFWT